MKSSVKPLLSSISISLRQSLQTHVILQGRRNFSAFALTTRRSSSVAWDLSRVGEVPGSLACPKEPRRSFSGSSEMNHQRVKGRRRFYKSVNVLEVPPKKQNGSPGLIDSRRWEVLLDGHVLKTPARSPLEFDSLELALAVATEWDSQTSKGGLEPALMPLMSLASTALDQVALDRERTITTCLKYLPTDTVCFPSPDPDPVMARKQRQLWAPLREWAAKELAIPLTTTTEIFSRPQHPAEAFANARALLESCDAWALAALQNVTMECKSLVIALALAYRNITVEKAFDAARLEEEYNVERWGLIEGGHDMDRANTTLTLTAASTLLWLRNASLPEPKLSSSR